MNKKIASLLLVCLVALSIVYVCSIAFPGDTTQSMDAVPSGPVIVTEEIRPGPPLNIRGDPIEDVKPH